MAYDIQYRLLNEEEKELFYKDFINFLSVHGIPGDEWEKIKKNDKPQMMLMFAQFSDLVIHKSLLNISYVYKLDEEACTLLKFDENNFEIVSILNLEKSKDIRTLLTKAESKSISLPYPEKGREKYIFQLTGLDGYSPCSDEYWSLLKG